MSARPPGLRSRREQRGSGSPLLRNGAVEPARVARDGVVHVIELVVLQRHGGEQRAVGGGQVATILQAIPGARGGILNQQREGFSGLVAPLSEQTPPDHLGVLSEVHDCGHDNPRRLCHVEDPIGELSGEQPPIRAGINRCYLRMLAQQSKGGIQLAHEHLASPLLIVLIPLKGGLNVVISLEKKNEFGHERANEGLPNRNH
jgi:hypothetical protein